MKKILIYNSGGGLGDSIQIIPLILSLKNHYRRSKIFYLGAHPNHFKGKLKEYNINVETLELDLQYFGQQYQGRCRGKAHTYPAKYYLKMLMAACR